MDAEPRRPAACEHIDEDPFDAGLVEILVLAKRYDILQQSGPIDTRPGVTYDKATEIRLAGHRAETPEQVRVEAFVDDFAGMGHEQ